MKGTLSIGVGGYGCGVENILKYGLGVRFGSPEQAGVRLLVIDGPREDQYILPGGFQVDTTDGSGEFFRLHRSPAGVIRTICSGGYVPYISPWLSERDARRIPNQSSMNPRAGGGSCRATGRATFYLHADDIQGILRAGLNEAIGYLPGAAHDEDTHPGGGQAIAFLKMSTVGAMGSGMGLDVAHLLKSIKDEGAMLVGVIALPNSYDSVIPDPAGRRRRDAKSMALLRELQRFQDTDGFPTRISYTHSTSVQNNQLLDVCFLIDGVASDLSLNDLHPRYGVCAAAADLEMAFLLDNGHIIPDLANWASSMTGSGRKYATFGVHSYIFPRVDLVETFSLRFARDVHVMLITPPEGAEDEGRKLADAMLGNCCFTGLALRLQEDEELPLTPSADVKNRQQLMELLNSFTVESKESSGFPPAVSDERVLELCSMVKTRRFWLFSVSNQEVVHGCQSVAENYVGKEADKPGGDSVYSWINRQMEHIEEEFVGALIRNVKGIFYHVKTGEPISLGDKPHVLMVARDYLLRLRELMELLASEFKDAYTRLVDDEAVVKKQRIRVEDIERRLSSAGRDSQMQREYIREYQRLMELEIWTILVRACADLAAKLHSIVDRWWREIGEPTQSWYAFLQEIVRYLDNQLRDILSRRTDTAGIKVRRYFPFPDDEAEKAMYDDLARGKQHHIELLRQMRFMFCSERHEKLGKTSGEDSIYKLYLHMPDVEGYDAQVDSKTLYDIVAGRYTNLRVEGYSPHEMVQYGRNCLGPALGNMGLPDAMMYDYTHRWRQLRHEDDDGLGTYAVKMASALSERAHVFLSQRPSGEGDTRSAVLKKFCLGHFMDLPNASPNTVQKLAALLTAEMSERTGVHEVDGMDDMMMCLNFQLGLSIHDWAYRENCMSQYEQYCRDPESELIQVYPEEQEALVLEEILRDEMLLNNGYLSASTVRYLADRKSFTSFAVSCALGLLEVKAGETGEPDEYVVRVETPGGGEASVSLGQCDQLDRVIARYLAPENAGVRTTVTGKLRDRLAEMEEQIGAQRVISELRSAAEALAAMEGFNPHDLQLAMKAAIYGFIGVMRHSHRYLAPLRLPVESI